MKFLNFKRVLCLSPHPDDVEYGMLGSICKYKDTKFDIFILSEGGDFDETVREERQRESQKSLENIDNSKCDLSGIKFIKDMGEDEWINLIETKYDMDSYDCVFCPPPEDSHFDHRFISQLASALVRRSKCGIINYRTPSALDTWIPNLFVDIGLNVSRDDKIHSDDTRKTFLANIWFLKKNRMKKFISQQSKSYFRESSIVSFHSNYNCSKIGINSVESFKINKIYN